MNFKNLKQMFEKQGTTIQPKIQNNQVPKSIPKPLVTNQLPINRIIEEKIILPQPKTTINKNFLQQLNKKLDNKNTNLSSIPARGQSYLQPSQISSQQNKKKQSQLKIEDIITGAAYTKQASNSSNLRYAINESNQKRTEQSNIFGQLGVMESSNDTVSFEELLTKAIKNMNLDSDQAKQSKKNYQPRKTKVVNKYQYGQERSTKEQKLQRIDFVLKVVFGLNQYQIVPSNKVQIKKDKILKNSQSKIQPLVPSQQSKKNKSQILFQNITPAIDSTASTIIPQRVSKSVNNAFLDELKKLQKKQSKFITNPQQIVNINTLQSKEKQTNVQTLTPRQKKKQKKQQNFDDL